MIKYENLVQGPANKMLLGLSVQSNRKKEKEEKNISIKKGRKKK